MKNLWVQRLQPRRTCNMQHVISTNRYNKRTITFDTFKYLIWYMISRAVSIWLFWDMRNIRFIFWLVGTGINSKFCWLRPNNRTVIAPCSYDMVNMTPFIFISCLFECIFFLLTVQNVLQLNQSVPSCPSIESISCYQNITVLLFCSLIYKVYTEDAWLGFMRSRDCLVRIGPWILVKNT